MKYFKMTIWSLIGIIISMSCFWILTLAQFTNELTFTTAEEKLTFTTIFSINFIIMSFSIGFIEELKNGRGK